MLLSTMVVAMTMMMVMMVMLLLTHQLYPWTALQQTVASIMIERNVSMRRN